MRFEGKLLYLSSRIYRETDGSGVEDSTDLSNKYLSHVNANAMHTSQHKFIPKLSPL